MMEKRKRYYVNGAGIISPQLTFDDNSFLESVQEYNTNALTCITPDFKAYINPIQLRRLNRMLRIGLSAATICIQNSRLQKIDGVIVGTGYGFLIDTAKFLEEVLSQNEKHVAPTHFMQSTYNSLAGLVALSIKCMGYNNTHVSKGFAFESALQDAMMQVNEDDALNFIVGAFDESDPVQYVINSRKHHFKKESISSLALFESETVGTIQGEGAAFFSLSAKPTESSLCRLIDLRMIFKPESETELKDSLDQLLLENGISISDVDIIISGASGDVMNDKLITSFCNSLNSIAQLRFKHLCGEYCTASSFAFWLASSILKKQTIPESVKKNDFETPSVIQRVLIVNQYMGRNYTMILLESLVA
ncbi:MAG TPA: beta-ketoacyl synthase chain length factor [Chryseolinea sp.]|nr:beta-ketoacyl synthase chain length factor [Chryseolinea sp.]HPH47479.1 beta-ketoacyl synthase chain length factor [Chryseolinea sp.]HPM31081.1 beta-ketoacyl synthase chain length factor [Chryseolinea sp.]